MALVAKFIDRIPLKLGRAKTSMVLVAIRAFDLSLPDRMVGSPILLGPLAFVAEIAEVWLRGL